MFHLAFEFSVVVFSCNLGGFLGIFDAVLVATALIVHFGKHAQRIAVVFFVVFLEAGIVNGALAIELCEAFLAENVVVDGHAYVVGIVGCHLVPCLHGVEYMEGEGGLFGVYLDDVLSCVGAVGAVSPFCLFSIAGNKEGCRHD